LERFGEVHDGTVRRLAERRRRFEVYRRNVEHIESTNRRSGLGENQFADLTAHELRTTGYEAISNRIVKCLVKFKMITLGHCTIKKKRSSNSVATVDC
jgi:hypothetical protein